jgi:predicted nucleotidyltransferase
MDTLEAVQERLLAVATRCARDLQARHQPAALLLYGSLARGGLTPFSDVDIAVVVPGALPAYRVEHRLVDDVKVDVIFSQMAAVTDLTVHVPQSLVGSPQVSAYLLESLLVAPEWIVLFDPTGAIRRVKQELQRLTRYETLALPWGREIYLGLLTSDLAPAVEQLQAGDWSGAMERARRIAQDLCITLRILTGIKDTEAATRGHNIPEFSVIVKEVKQLCSPPREAVRAVYLALSSLWEYSLRTAYEPVIERLALAGVDEPERLELIGAYEFYWSGYRLTELGRVTADIGLSLQWSRFELERQDLTEALWALRKCDSAAAMNRIWAAIGTALLTAGHDLTALVRSLLDDPEFRRRGEVVERARQELLPATACRAHAERALSLIQELQMLLEGAFPLKSS